MPAALSDTQNRYLALAWLCVDAEPKLTGSKTPHSAREMLRVTKKKLLEFDTTLSTANGTIAPPNTPATKTPRKTATKATPQTKSTKGKANKKRKVASDSEGSEDDNETPLKNKIVVKSEPVDDVSEAGADAGAEPEDAEV
ncbi:unnamed protein product [Aureobasidium vineae]|uniref:Uncharacterized protein n=1 Tax=Aureobasidium vineae TaxID=2773715 RepID=A0A9N8JAV8_9PEZI|nr:unnamed protein product [Aureobasidium vineae]